MVKQSAAPATATSQVHGSSDGGDTGNNRYRHTTNISQSNIPPTSHFPSLKYHFPNLYKVRWLRVDINVNLCLYISFYHAKYKPFLTASLQEEWKTHNRSLTAIINVLKISKLCEFWCCKWWIVISEDTVTTWPHWVVDSRTAPSPRSATRINTCWVTT